MKLDAYDVIVVGAGPAGTTLANLLAQSGISCALLEQHFSLDREFRGPGFQPSVLKIIDEMGYRKDLEALPHQEIHNFSFSEKHLSFLEIDVREHAKPPYDYVSIMPQGPLLNMLVKKSSEFANFHYYGGFAVNGLMMDQGVTSGVVGTHLGEAIALKSRLVVACDGRYSTVRSASGIELNKRDTTFDVIWFYVPPLHGKQSRFNLSIEKGGLTINIPKEDGGSQMGWMIPKGTYGEVQKRGIEEFREVFWKSSPELKETLEKALPDFSRCHLLDVTVGEASEWLRDGLILIGDAAHVASPVGAQGNALAVQDAAILHPFIVDALKHTNGILKAESFSDCIQSRKKDIDAILAFQMRVQKMMISRKNLFTKFVRKVFLPLMSHTKIKDQIVHMILWGKRPISVSKERFEEKFPKFQYFEVMDVIEETKDAKSYVLKAHRDFPFQPGQFITIRVCVEGFYYERCYSLSSGSVLRITPKRMPFGVVSNFLHDYLEKGSEILALPPQGTFFQHSHLKEKKNVITIAGGSGITPLYSILDNLLHTRNDLHCTLLYACHDASSIILQKDIERLQKDHLDRLSVHYFLSNKERLTPQILEKHLQDQAAYYLCGPSSLQEMVLNTLQKNNIETKDVHIEMFSSARGKKEVQALHQEGSEQLIIGTGEEKPCKKVSITLKEKTTEVKPSLNETILDMALRSKIPAPYSCKEGVCATCKAKILKGKVSMEKYDALSSYDQETQFALTCQAKPLTEEVEVDFDA